MTYNNALNLKTAGVVHNDAAGSVTGNPLIAYSVVCGGPTSTGIPQSVANVGTATQVLTSNGPAALPSWQANSAAGAVLTITGNSGGPESPSANNFNILGTGSITTVGTAATETIQLTGLTNHNVLIGAGTATVTKVAPSATAGVPLISNGAAADPSFGTAVVAGGGTGITSTVAYSVIVGGTTSTSALQPLASIGSSGQVLTSNGPGVLPNWQTNAASSGFTTLATQVFTTSGTYTPTSGMKYCIVQCVGAGGGGAAAANTGNTVGCCGGAGGYSSKVLDAATVGVSQAVTVSSAGGSGGAAGNNPGVTGGTTSFGAIMTATGGTGGGVLGGVGGPGGTGTGGDFNCTGEAGGNALLYAPGPLLLSLGGGGNCFFGGGAPAVLIFTASSAGNNATSYGGGGSGACNYSTAAEPGGNGGPGLIVVTEYIS